MENSTLDEREQAIRDVAEKIAQYSITGSEIAMYLAPTPIIKIPSKPASAKYRSVAGDVWSGRGRKPAWVVKYEASGGKLSDCALNPTDQII
ncbi:MAG: H-NS histone family protein [Candidatus Saccharibacteria bacterium]|nr:H-NS histone family protein [Candidatus Saccharibacteria bacterium]